ncbi:MurR/RpiR family transcriptional regulator [Actinomadura sp. ATCC 31491]|uniref:MurR/RpiR family transcriptional regulator n=1 Tax=Actinomadura luzonensis TaxID=2805427 RepID=A0ABT0G491_9ACTN|nr:MurR/RpiR family transcriptional regulator [Actinomadura luzonensis]MCK2219413.1 MurR/RpiR family transcriptional regulator [Actinomadura luzonensis]
METDAVEDRLGEVYATLPPGERAIVRVLLDDWPFAALGSLRALAERAGVSPPTASRLFDRLGYRGFADFQNAVRKGARERSRLLEFVQPGPERAAAGEATGGAVEVRRAADELRAGLDSTLAAVTEPLLEAAAGLLAGARTVWALGGPLSELAAEYLVRQLASLRPGVHRVPGDPQARARAVLDLGPQDVLAAYDFRRYSPATARFAGAARARGARLVLITDAWESPLAPEAELLVRLPREAAGPIAPLAHEIAVTELLLVAAAARLSPAGRLADLDAIARTL